MMTKSVNVYLYLIEANCPSLNVTYGHVWYNRPGINHGYPPNTLATFSCNIGYEVVGSDSLTCLSSGEWSKLPKCGGNKVKKTLQFLQIGILFLH